MTMDNYFDETSVLPTSTSLKPTIIPTQSSSAPIVTETTQSYILTPSTTPPGTPATPNRNENSKTIASELDHINKKFNA